MNHDGFPRQRLRRLRRLPRLRALAAETSLLPGQLIYPVFIHDRDDDQPAPGLVGQQRLGRDGLMRVAERALALGVAGLALFPVLADELKSDDARAACDPGGLLPRAVAELKARFPELLCICDVALDPYTRHGQDGIVGPDGAVLNDPTVRVLVQQALCQAAAGADIIAPSDMMDGRIGAIRDALERDGFGDVALLSYCAKYCSHLYGPFRGAVGSAASLGRGNKKCYQMNVANRREASGELALDLAEGADMVMVKPAGWYADVIAQMRAQCSVPVLGYVVSGEYVMLELAAQAGAVPRREAVLELLLCLRRAGADALLTYHALDAAAWLRQG